MNLDDNTTKILIAIIGVAAVGGTIIGIRISKKKNSNNTINQNNNNVTNGDIVAGDKKG